MRHPDGPGEHDGRPASGPDSFCTGQTIDQKRLGQVAVPVETVLAHLSVIA